VAARGGIPRAVTPARQTGGAGKPPAAAESEAAASGGKWGAGQANNAPEPGYVAPVDLISQDWADGAAGQPAPAGGGAALPGRLGDRP
jgi:hypothetical protein